MKTIQEAAENYLSLNFLEATIWTQETKDAFTAGVEFAQKWISVEEELPDADKDDMWNDTHNYSKKVITKNDELTFQNYEIQAYNIELQEWQTQNKVTHWRPIELK